MPLGLTKRAFLRLAGLSIAPKVLPSWLSPQMLRAETVGKRAGSRVIIVTFGGGVRYSETFSPKGCATFRVSPRCVPKDIFSNPAAIKASSRISIPPPAS